MDWVAISDPTVVEMSGSDRHPILRPGRATDSVPGAVLSLTAAELDATHAYEVSA